MPKVGVQNMAGEQVGEIELAGSVFEVEANVPLMHQAVVAENANARQGTHDTRTRGEVSGGGAKPYRQKGTGRARQGSSRSPVHPHGGVAFGPHPRSYSQALPKKMRRGALKSALSARLADGVVTVVDQITMDKISTKRMAEFLNKFEAYGKTIVLLDGLTEEVRKSTRNIPGVSLRVSPAVSVRDVLGADRIIMTRAAAEKLQEVFA
jgi:large subunit ribosomal protein L4